MESIDALTGKITKVRQAMESADVKYVMGLLDEIAHDKLTQDLLNKGEEAVRALGFQQGINVIKILPDIFEQQLKALQMTSQKELKDKLRI